MYDMKNFQITDKDSNKQYWISRSMAIHGILLVHDYERNQKFLLIEKRGPGCPDEIGKWADPTGYLDWNETTKEALHREVWEETGLDLMKVTHKISFYGIDDLPVGRQNVTIRYKVDLEYPEIKPLLKSGVINSDTVSRGGEEGEVSGVDLLKIYPRDSEVDPKLFAFDHGELINEIIKNLNQ